VTRIVAGQHGGRRIAVPDGRDTRPTTDRVREALFGALGDLAGVRFLDLYAGSGAIGLEAASRGADHVLLVEQGARAAKTARENIALLRLSGTVQLSVGPVESRLLTGPPGEPYDVVFADPPYGTGPDEITTMLDGLVRHGWLGPEATVVVERSTRSPEPVWVEGVTLERSRRYGETTLWYGRGS
jgi:16S rRNA (guanine(966)-N(2))-methyltransferase RsmD